MAGGREYNDGVGVGGNPPDIFLERGLRLSMDFAPLKRVPPT